MKVNCYLCFLGANGLVRDVLSDANVMIQAFVQVPIMNRSHICHCQPVWRANHLFPHHWKSCHGNCRTRNHPNKRQERGMHYSHRSLALTTEHWINTGDVLFIIIFFYFCAQHQCRHRLEGKMSWTLGSKDCLFTCLVIAGNRLLQWEMIKHLGSLWQ